MNALSHNRPRPTEPGPAIRTGAPRHIEFAGHQLQRIAARSARAWPRG